MFGRRHERAGHPASPSASGPLVGIGALVRVTSKPGEPDQWVDEPIGVVVSIGANEVYGYPGLTRPRFWTVSFDGFEYMADGRGPFEQALIPEWRLEVIEPQPLAFEEPELRPE